MLPGHGQKVVCKPSLVFSFGFDQAGQLSMLTFNQSVQNNQIGSDIIVI